MNTRSPLVPWLVPSILLAAVPLLPATESTSGGSYWPHWRGPSANGVSPDGRPPTEWGPSKNVKWKVKIPGGGSGSPIIWEDKVFVVTAVPVETASRADAPRADRPRGRPGARGRRGGGRSGRGGTMRPPDSHWRFVVMCLDRSSGKTLWEKVAAETIPHEGHHAHHGFASASPCTDGERLYAHFGSRGLFCYDLDGEFLWKKTDFGPMRTRHGFGEGSSPTVHGDFIIVPWDHEGSSFLTALDKRTGKTRWKVERDEPSCWATPLVVEHDGRKQVVASGDNFVRGYDLETGAELWRCPGQTGRPIPSPVSGHGLVFVGSGHRGAFLGAFRLDHKGDIEGTDGVAWTLDRHAPDVPSPLLSGRRLYFHAGRTGILSCYDAVTGKPHFAGERVKGLDAVYASPVAANGKLYLTGRDGTTVVVEDREELTIVATNRLDEPVDATPAVAGREILIRAREHLYCFAE